MGLFDIFFKNRPKTQGKYEGKFEILSGYEPRFTSWGGNIYEQELVRAAINARAVHISKLKFESQGSARPALQGKLAKAPNQLRASSSSTKRSRSWLGSTRVSRG